MLHNSVSLNAIKFSMYFWILIRGHVRPSASPILFANNSKRHSLRTDDDEIRHGPRESLGPFQNDIVI